MSYNYRIIKDEQGYTIHEVYYTKGKPTMWTDEVVPHGETLKELKEDFKLYRQAFKRPILEVRGKKLVRRTERIN